MYRTSDQWRDPIMISFIVHFKQSRHIGSWINSHLHTMPLTGKFKCTLIAVMRSWIHSSHPSTCTSLFCNLRSYTEFSLKRFLFWTLLDFILQPKVMEFLLFAAFMYIVLILLDIFRDTNISVSDPSSLEAGHVQLTQ